MRTIYQVAWLMGLGVALLGAVPGCETEPQGAVSSWSYNRQLDDSYVPDYNPYKESDASSGMENNVSTHGGNIANTGATSGGSTGVSGEQSVPSAVEGSR